MISTTSFSSSSCHTQSVTSRLETSLYRDFSQFFESIGLGLENFGLGIGFENISLEKNSWYRSQKYLVLKKSLGIGLKKSLSISLENIWSQKSLGISLENIWS